MKVIRCSWFYLSILIGTLIIISNSCTKKESLTIPILSTSPVTNIVATIASSGGEITSDGGASVTERGVCWSTSANPTIAASTKTSDGTGIGTFTSSITGLTASTLYHVRSYATNSAGTAYGSDVTFSTTVAIVIPTLTTTVASSINQTTATSGGNVTNDGGATVTARGVCWSTTSGPTTALSTKTSDGTGTGAFTSSLTGLIATTIYYVKAYATNSVGTTYGNEITFTTSAPPSIVPDAPTIGTAIAGTAQATITFTASVSDGGSAITGYTVTSSPGGLTRTGTASPITVTGLTNGTAYTFTVTATNAIGTSVASSASNSAIPTAPVTDIDGNVYNTVTIGTQIWMSENLKATKYNDGTAIPNITNDAIWAAETTGAYCDYNNSPANSTTYGRMYNWYTIDNNASTKVSSNGGKNVCPINWHVPSDDEWTTLTSFLGGETIAGGKLKETGTSHWASPNTGATNETGFTALPGGYRYDIPLGGEEIFNLIGSYGTWWSTTESQTGGGGVWLRGIQSSSTSVLRYDYFKLSGYSVRCVRDF